MLTFVSFPSIEGFHNVIRSSAKFLEVTEPAPLQWPYLGYNGSTPRGQATYRGKIKLHGTNAAVRTNGEEVLPQSRTAELSIQSDNHGFARWTHANLDYWKSIGVGKELTIFGEWCGPGIMKSTAIQKIPHKIFAVFAVIDGDKFIIEPDEISKIMGDRPADVYVLPWQGEAFTVDYTNRDSLQPIADMLNGVVDSVEPTDPWVKSTFGIEGTGEGVVYYPAVGESPCSIEFFNNFSFKAKGEKHKVTKTKEAVQIDPEVAASIEEFVSMTVTEARLEQGLENVGGLVDMKNVGPFLQWVCTDVKKETEDELEASDLTWDQVAKQVQAAARTWFITKFKQI